jgi:hypothetical protein
VIPFGIKHIIIPNISPRALKWPDALLAVNDSTLRKSEVLNKHMDIHCKSENGLFRGMKHKAIRRHQSENLIRPDSDTLKLSPEVYSFDLTSSRDIDSEFDPIDADHYCGPWTTPAQTSLYNDRVESNEKGNIDSFKIERYHLPPRSETAVIDDVMKTNRHSSSSQHEDSKNVSIDDVIQVKRLQNPAELAKSDISVSQNREHGPETWAKKQIVVQMPQPAAPNYPATPPSGCSENELDRSISRTAGKEGAEFYTELQSHYTITNDT